MYVYTFLEMFKKLTIKIKVVPFPLRIFLISPPFGNFLCVLQQLDQVYHITAPWQLFYTCEDNGYIFFEPSLCFFADYLIISEGLSSRYTQIYVRFLKHVLVFI